MTRDELVEVMAEGAHDAWMETYRSWGFTSRKAEWGEEFMVPFAQLSDRGKDLDRTIMRGILKQFETKGLQVVPR